MKTIFPPLLFAAVSMLVGCSASSRPDVEKERVSTRESDLEALRGDTQGATTPPPERPSPPRRSLDLQTILDEAENGDVVGIPFGEYRLANGLVIEGGKDLTVTARFGTRILVEDTDADVLTVDGGNGVRIENLYLRHIEPRKEYECHGAVVRVRNATNVRIVNCELNGCGAVGVSARTVKGLLVRKCFIHHNSFNAFYIDDGDEVKIQSCIVEDNGNFIQRYGAGSLEMRDNVLRRNGGYWEAHPDPHPGPDGDLPQTQ